MRRLLIGFIVCLFVSKPVMAQDTVSTHITYDLTTEVAMGSGDFTAYQLNANRHHILATRPNTAYMRGAISMEQRIAENWKLSGAIDAVFSVHADNGAYLQQYYINLGWKDFFTN